RSEGASGDGGPAEESDDEGERDEHEERHAAHVTDTSERAKGLLRQQMSAAKRHDHGWASNQSAMRLACSTRLRGFPPRVRSWLSSGKRTNCVSTPCSRSAVKNCSACSIGQRRSRSAWRMSSGVFTFGA